METPLQKKHKRFDLPSLSPYHSNKNELTFNSEFTQSMLKDNNIVRGDTPQSLARTLQYLGDPIVKIPDIIEVTILFLTFCHPANHSLRI